MYFIELRYTNGKEVRLPEPYLLWQEAYRVSMKFISAQYTVYIAQD